MAGQTIVPDELPIGENRIFTESSFFKKNLGDLPSPDQVRQRDIETNGIRARCERPPAVLFKEQGLVVKYGSFITTAEAQCLWYFNRYIKDHVPTPELYGWCQDAGETFIYMELIPGETLKEAWPSMTEEEQDIVCSELRDCVAAWRSLRQEKEPYYIGHIGRQGMGDIIFHDIGDAHIGPFEDIKAFHDFFSRHAGPADTEYSPRREIPYLKGLTNDRAVVFTHGDLDKSNIMVSRREGDSSRHVAAIIDWHQSGWYPADWEWLKAQGMCDPVDGGYRDLAWLDKIMNRADKDYFEAWEFTTMSAGSF